MTKTVKPRMGSVPQDALGRVVAHMTAGLSKVDLSSGKHYGLLGWREMDPVDARTKYLDASWRHLHAMMLGEDRDPESGELHAVALACNGLILADIVLRMGPAARPEARPPRVEHEVQQGEAPQ